MVSARANIWQTFFSVFAAPMKRGNFASISFKCYSCAIHTRHLDSKIARNWMANPCKCLLANVDVFAFFGINAIIFHTLAARNATYPKLQTVVNIKHISSETIQSDCFFPYHCRRINRVSCYHRESHHYGNNNWRVNWRNSSDGTPTKMK